MYDVSLKRKWDNKAVLDYAEQKGVEKGKKEVVGNLLVTGKFSVSEIANFASVTEGFVQKVRADLDRKRK